MVTPITMVLCPNCRVIAKLGSTCINCKCPVTRGKPKATCREATANGSVETRPVAKHKAEAILRLQGRGIVVE